MNEESIKKAEAIINAYRLNNFFNGTLQDLELITQYVNYKSNKNYTFCYTCSESIRELLKMANNWLMKDAGFKSEPEIKQNKRKRFNP